MTVCTPQTMNKAKRKFRAVCVISGESFDDQTCGLLSLCFAAKKDGKVIGAYDTFLYTVSQSQS